MMLPRVNVFVANEHTCESFIDSSDENGICNLTQDWDSRPPGIPEHWHVLKMFLEGLTSVRNKAFIEILHLLLLIYNKRLKILLVTSYLSPQGIPLPGLTTSA